MFNRLSFGSIGFRALNITLAEIFQVLIALVILWAGYHQTPDGLKQDAILRTIIYGTPWNP